RGAVARLLVGFGGERAALGAGAERRRRRRFGAALRPRRLAAVGAFLERPAQGGRHGLDDVPRILHAMPADPQRKRRRALLEAGVAAADGAGGNELLALVAAVAFDMRPALRIAPV